MLYSFGCGVGTRSVSYAAKPTHEGAIWDADGAALCYWVRAVPTDNIRATYILEAFAV